jgi:hypothetical protein
MHGVKLMTVVQLLTTEQEARRRGCAETANACRRELAGRIGETLEQSEREVYRLYEQTGDERLRTVM